ncbi:MAG: hypothetical protein IT508_12625, partial [Burkholderiaceae bacterium]|nr:hypothetical protein [Burkholderiaceae bacterium]
MFSKLFRREYVIDEAYMPILLNSLEAVKANNEYDYPSVIEEILEAHGPMPPQQMMIMLAERGTPVKAMAEAKKRLKATKPKDIRFSANIHRRIMYLLE